MEDRILRVMSDISKRAHRRTFNTQLTSQPVKLLDSFGHEQLGSGSLLSETPVRTMSTEIHPAPRRLPLCPEAASSISAYRLVIIKLHYTPAPYSLRWYNKALPLEFPITTYSLLGEKSTAVTLPNGVLCVGQFANDVRVGTCIYNAR